MHASVASRIGYFLTGIRKYRPWQGTEQICSFPVFTLGLSKFELTSVGTISDRFDILLAISLGFLYDKIRKNEKERGKLANEAE